MTSKGDKTYTSELYNSIKCHKICQSAAPVLITCCLLTNDTLQRFINKKLNLYIVMFLKRKKCEITLSKNTNHHILITLFLRYKDILNLLFYVILG